MTWKSINGEYPQNNQLVFVYDKYSDTSTLARFKELDDDEYLFEAMFFGDMQIDYNVTHWMPLPKPTDSL